MDAVAAQAHRVSGSRKTSFIYDDARGKAERKMMADGVERSVQMNIRELSGRYSDANVGFIRPFMQQIMQTFFEHKQEDLKFANGAFFQAQGDIEDSAESFVWGSEELLLGPGDHSEEMLDSVIKDVNVQDVEYGDARVNMQVERVFTALAGWRFNELDVIKSRAGNYSQINAVMRAARRRHDLAMEIWHAFGSAKRGVYGLLNAPDIPRITNSVGAWNRSNTSSNFPARLFDYLNELISDVVDRTDGVLNCNTAIFPAAEYLYLAQTMLDVNSGSDRTILQALQAANPSITQWDWTQRLKGLTDEGYSGNSALFYNRDIDSVSGHYAFMMRGVPPVRDHLVTKNLSWSRIGNLTIAQPKSFFRLDGLQS